MTDLSKLKELASKASASRGKSSFEAVPTMHAFNLAIEPEDVLTLIEVAEKARAVAFSNGFDAALPDKREALVAALRKLSA